MPPRASWPLRPGAASLPILTELRGLTHPIVSWAALSAATPADPATLLHLSAVGSAPRLRALWADLLDQRRTRITLRDRHGTALVAVRSDGRYYTAWSDAPLPASGLLHLSLPKAAKVVRAAARSLGCALASPRRLRAALRDLMADLARAGRQRRRIRHPNAYQLLQDPALLSLT
jgi:hypothetical protein